MKAKLFAVVAALLAGVLGAIQPANAVIQNGVWLGWITGEVFQVHCQGRNTQASDYLHWYQYDIRVCNIEATWGNPGSWTYYYDHKDERGQTVLVPVNSTSISNLVVQIPYACPAALFASNRIEAFNIPNGQFYSLYNYDGDQVNCGDPW